MGDIPNYAPAELKIVDNSALLSTYAEFGTFYIDFRYRKIRGFIRWQTNDLKNTVDNSYNTDK